MKNSIFGIFKGGLKRFTNHPQLWFTVFVAFAICASYIYVATRFISIAQDAQEGLINTRIGALQDAFVPLAGELTKHPDALRKHMKDIAEQNLTITDFFIVKETNKGWIVTLATDENKEGSNFTGYDFLLSLANSDTSNSFTVEEQSSDGRFFRTVRAIVDKGGNPVAVVVTRQTLSAVDKQISSSIRSTVIILVLVLLFLLGLFLRHARIIDYSQLYKKLKEVDTMKDDFISMASHELRTPLSAIRGYADLLSTSGEVVSDEGKKFLSRIDISASDLDRLISDILDVSRIEQGKLVFNIESVKPVEIISSVCDTLRFKAEKKGLELKTDFKANPDIKVDKDRLRQVVVNLVGNAIKYTKEGEILTSTYIDGMKFAIRVSDTGLGMTAEEQKNLFAKFYRAEGKDVRAQVGTGLGLWITKRMVEDMGGEISVESIKGVGSHFIVKFPVAES